MIVIIAVVIMILLSISVYYLTKSSNYCTCTGYGQQVSSNSPLLDLWGAGGNASSEEPVDPDVASPGYKQDYLAYEPSIWSVAEENKSGCMCNYGDYVRKRVVPLEMVGASVPPGSVSNNVQSFPLTRGYEYKGYQTAPATTHRYGSYSGESNPDYAVGIM